MGRLRAERTSGSDAKRSVVKYVRTERFHPAAMRWGRIRVPQKYYCSGTRRTLSVLAIAEISHRWATWRTVVNIEEYRDSSVVSSGIQRDRQINSSSADSNSSSNTQSSSINDVDGWPRANYKFVSVVFFKSKRPAGNDLHLLWMSAHKLDSEKPCK